MKQFTTPEQTAKLIELGFDWNNNYNRNCSYSRSEDDFRPQK